MGLGRRRVRLEQSERWVYNRMADAYPARPPYPEALVARLSALAQSAARRQPAHIADLGAGIGHLSLPLAALGHRVSAVEPAYAMLQVLRERAQLQGGAVCALHALHAMAEELPLQDASVDLALIADALHFLDAHRTGSELARVLHEGAALAVVHVELGASPFMQALQQLMHESAPRRPRSVGSATTQLAALAGVALDPPQTFDSRLQMDLEQIECILRSISFIGPAMNAARFRTFRRRLRGIEHPPVWHTSVRLWAGRRTGV